MLVKAARFANLLVEALNAGVSFSHVLQAPQKAKLDRGSYLAAQQTLYLNYGRAARFLEPAALASSIALAALQHKHKNEALLMAASAGCVVAEIAVWKKGLDPINREVATWDVRGMPDNWPKYRNRWHALHAVRNALCVGAFSASLLALLQKTNKKSLSLRAFKSRAA